VLTRDEKKSRGRLATIDAVCCSKDELIEGIPFFRRRERWREKGKGREKGVKEGAEGEDDRGKADQKKEREYVCV
jgi:hypothetical protein